MAASSKLSSTAATDVQLARRPEATFLKAATTKQPFEEVEPGSSVRGAIKQPAEKAESLPSQGTITKQPARKQDSVFPNGTATAGHAAAAVVAQTTKNASLATDSKPSRPAKPARGGQDFAQAVRKAVTYSSETIRATALSSTITSAHPKIFIAELQPKYNQMLLEGAINLGDEVSAEQV